MKKLIFIYIAIFFFNISHAVEKNNNLLSESEILDFFNLLKNKSYTEFYQFAQESCENIIKNVGYEKVYKDANLYVNDKKNQIFFAFQSTERESPEAALEWCSTIMSGYTKKTLQEVENKLNDSGENSSIKLNFITKIFQNLAYLENNQTKKIEFAIFPSLTHIYWHWNKKGYFKVTKPDVRTGDCLNSNILDGSYKNVFLIDDPESIALCIAQHNGYDQALTAMRNKEKQNLAKKAEEQRNAIEEKERKAKEKEEAERLSVESMPLFNRSIELMRIPVTLCDDYYDKCREWNLRGHIGIFNYNGIPSLEFTYIKPVEDKSGPQNYASLFIDKRELDCKRAQFNKAKEWAGIAKKHNAEVNKTITSEHIGCDAYPPLFVKYNKSNKEVKIGFNEYIPQTDYTYAYNVTILLNMNSFNKLKKFIEKDLTHHENEAIKIINKENDTDALFN
jgi:hypothetical protein